MVRIHEEYLDTWWGWELTPEEKKDIESGKVMDEILDSDLEYELDLMTEKKKVRLTGKYSEKRYIP